jgi:hypothetical protein
VKLFRGTNMANDIIAKCIAANAIDNGGIIVGATRTDDQLGSNYQINTYSSTIPDTGIVFNKYDTRFTGIAPCVNKCKVVGDIVQDGVVGVLFV